MKVAVAYNNGQIGEHFGHAEYFAIYTTNNDQTEITGKKVIEVKETGHQAVAQAIQQDLAVIGVNMEITSEDWQTFLNDRKSGNFDVAREGWLADYDDPINMLEMFTSDSGNNDMQLGK